MDTRISFIHQLGRGDDQAWRQMNHAYRLLIVNWLHRHDVKRSDAEDITQEVLTIVSQKVREFEHCGHIGAFRNWLKRITVFTAQNYMRKKRSQPEATGSTVFMEMLEQLQQADSDLSLQFDREQPQCMAGLVAGDIVNDSVS